MNPRFKPRIIEMLSDLQSGSRYVVDVDVVETLEAERDALWNLVDRAAKQMMMACGDGLLIHTDSNNPIAAWLADQQTAFRSMPPASPSGERLP